MNKDLHIAQTSLIPYISGGKPLDNNINITCGTNVSSVFSSLSGYVIIKNKTTCYVLTSNQNGFDSFMALGVDTEQKENIDFVFVKEVEDIKKGGLIRILNDFFMHPKVDEILKVLEKRLYVIDIIDGSRISNNINPNP